MIKYGNVFNQTVVLMWLRLHYYLQLIEKRTTKLIFQKPKRKIKAWLNQPGSWLNKRQCTLQFFFPQDNNGKDGIIFKGTGKRISEEEKLAYHNAADVYWQKSAWGDTQVSVEWVKNTLKLAVKQLGEFILFCGNLQGQVIDSFCLK